MGRKFEYYFAINIPNLHRNPSFSITGPYTDDNEIPMSLHPHFSLTLNPKLCQLDK